MATARILVSQPSPAVIEKSPFYEIANRHKVGFNYQPLIRVEGVTLKEFRAQRVEILDHSCVIFTSRMTVDSFFNICKEARITIPEAMKYICQTEAVALYLQKYIVYRKRKISYADGSFQNLLELIVKHKSEKFLVALSEPFKPELPEAIQRLNLNHSRVILAHTVAQDMSGVDSSSFNVIALYSPTDVKALIKKFSIDNLPDVAVFGEATLRSAIDAGLRVKAMAPTPEALSMAKAIDIYLTKLHNGETIEDITPLEDGKKDEFIRTQQCKLERKSRARRSSSDTTKK